jgi:hypothetical protein
MTQDEIKEFVIKDSIVVEGIVGEDYVWYHAKILSAKMSQWDLDFQKLVKVMESRHQDQLKMLQSVMDENRELKKQLKEKK